MGSLQTYLIRRLLLIIPTLLGISIVIFVALRFLPGDIVESLAGEFAVTPEFREAIEEKYSLNNSMFQQYFQWLGNVLTLDFGESLIRHYPVNEILKQKLPVTVEYGAMSLFISIIIAIPVGIISAIRQDSVIDYVTRSFAIGALAVPTFWVSILAITYGFIWFGWTPPLRYTHFWDDPVENIKLLWVPALILGTHLSGQIMRLTRSSMLEALRQDYVRTAWAKGLRERVVIIRHVLRNALIPVVTIIGTRIPFLISGTVILESIFGIPGMGSFFITSINERDYTVVQAIVLISAVLVVFTNLIVDAAYSIIDPRIRYT